MTATNQIGEERGRSRDTVGPTLSVCDAEALLFCSREGAFFAESNMLHKTKICALEGTTTPRAAHA